MSTKLVNSVIFGKNYCRLCFGDAYEDDLRFHDEVILNLKSEKISSMLTHILGGKYTSNMSVSDIICNSCVQSLKNSYNFVRMCKNNSDRLKNTVVALNEALLSVECTKTSKSVLIQIDTTDYSFMQFYQYKTCKQYITVPPSAVSGYSKYLITHDKSTKIPTSQVCGTGTLSRYKGSHARKKPVTDDSTVIPVEMENAGVQHRPKTQAKCSLKERQNRLKMLIKKEKELKEITDEMIAEVKPAKKLTMKEHEKIIRAATKKLLGITANMNKFVCNECGKGCSSRSGMVYHLQNKHSVCKRYSCRYCDDVFNDANKLRRHIQSRHVSEKIARCDLCNTTFRFLSSVYRHRKKHFNPKSSLYIKRN